MDEGYEQGEWQQVNLLQCSYAPDYCFKVHNKNVNPSFNDK